MTKTDPVRVVGWACQPEPEPSDANRCTFTSRYALWAKREICDKCIRDVPGNHRPLILAHDEAGWLERLVDKLDNEPDPQMADADTRYTIRTHAKFLRELK